MRAVPGRLLLRALVRRDHHAAAGEGRGHGGGAGAARWALTASRPATGCAPGPPTRPGTPGCRGTPAARSATVVERAGRHPLADDRARGLPADAAAGLHVRFAAADLFGAGDHTVTVELWQEYLTPIEEAVMSGDHGSSVISREVRHVEALLESRGLLDAGEIDTRIDEFLAGGSPANGARIVARAWVDPGFAERLLADANTAIREVGLSMAGGLQEQRLKVVANTAGDAQRRRLHAVLVLPDRAARALAQLVQERGLPLPGGARPARRCSPSSVSSCRPGRRSRSGTPARSRGTWCCPAVRRAPTTSPRTSSPPWSPARA